MTSNPSKPYDDERLGRLLALLRAAPRAWIERAKRIPLAQREVEELERLLAGDPTLRKSFDTDPVQAAEAAGMRDLAARLEQELDLLLSEAQEVVAHGKQREPATSRLRALLLRSQAVRERLGL
jgi:hypothetical protein